MAVLNSNNITQPGDGLNLNGNVLNINNPNRGIYTEDEFNEFTETQKNSGTYFVIGNVVSENNNTVSELRIISNGKEVKFQGNASDSYEWWSPKMTSDNTPEPFIASAVGTYPSLYAWYAFDGNLETSWNNYSVGGYPIYSSSLQLVTGNMIDCKGIRLKTQTSSIYMPLFTLQISFDLGKTWINYITVSTLPTPTEDDWYEYYFDAPISFNAIKLTNMSDAEKYTGIIVDIEFLKNKVVSTSKANNYIMASNDILSNDYASFMPVTTVGVINSIESVDSIDDTNNIN